MPDRLLHVPNAQPPLPSDWEVHPTHPSHHVPYALASFWDCGLRQHVDKKSAKVAAQRKRQQLATGAATGLGRGEVPRDLRESAKRSPVVKTWVRALEEPVRLYLQGHSLGAANAAAAPAPDPAAASATSSDELDSEDEEIVFVGRKKAAAAVAASTPSAVPAPRGGWRLAHREVQDETVDHGMVFDAFGDHESAPFKYAALLYVCVMWLLTVDVYRRWLTHSISDYYGLESSSVIVQNPARKVVYVKLGKTQRKQGVSGKQFPRPLWEVC